MNFVAIFMSVFAIIALVDRVIGNKFGLGKELERRKEKSKKRI